MAPLKLPRPWSDLSNAERFEFYETFNRVLAGLARDLELGCDTMLAEGGCSMRVRVRMHLVVDPNDDPRLSR